MNRASASTAIGRVRVVIVDDHAMIRQSVRQQLSEDSAITVVGEASNGADAVAAVKTIKPDVVTLDIRLPGRNGIEVAKEIKQVAPQTKIVVLTGFDDESYVRAFARLGVSGYILKSASGKELRKAVHEAAEGIVSLSPSTAQELDELRASETKYKELVEGTPDVARGIAERGRSWQIIQRLATILDHTPDLVGIADPQGSVLYLNLAGRIMLGIGAEESLFGITIASAHPPGAREKVLAQGIPEAIRSGVWSDDTIIVAKDGRQTPVSLVVMAHKARDGTVEFLSAMARDISGRKRGEERIQLEAKRAATLARVAARLNSTLDQRAVMNAVCEESAKALEVPVAVAYLHDEKSQTFEPVAAQGVPGVLLASLPPLPSSVYDQTIGEGKDLVLFRDLQAVMNDEFRRALDLRSGLGVLLTREGAVLGSLNMATTQETRIFTADERALLEAIAAQASQAIANSKLFEETAQRRRELEVVAKLVAALRSAANAREMYPIVLSQTTEMLKASGAAIAVKTADGSEIVSEEASGLLAAREGLSRKSGEGLSGKVMASGAPYVSRDANADPDFYRRDLFPAMSGPVAMIGAPLVAAQDTIGVLWVSRGEPFAGSEVGLVTAIAGIAANAIRRATAHEQTEQQLRWTSAMREIGMAISGSVDLSLTLNVLVDQVAAHLGADAASVLLFDQATQSLVHGASRGFRSEAIRMTSVRLGDEVEGLAALENRAVAIPNLGAIESRSGRFELLLGEGLVAFHAAPLVAKGHLRGLLEVFHRSETALSGDQMNFLKAVAAQGAIAVDDATLFDGLQRSNLELALAYDRTLEGWASVLELRDYETAGHSRRVGEMTVRLAREIGVPEPDLANLRRGVLLHDIGKMAIPDAILLKPGPLTDEEWSVINRHPAYAFQVLSPISFLRPALDIPYCHHEKWDGSGYPRGLKGTEIPLAARIFAVVDVWDALLHERPYKAAWSEDAARGHLKSLAGTHFDPAVVDAFVRLAWPEHSTE